MQQTRETNIDFTIPPSGNSEPEWLSKRRNAAREAFNSSDLPRRGLHLWRYTDPGQFLISRKQIAIKQESTKTDADNYLAKLERGEIAGLAIDHAGEEIICYSPAPLTEQSVLLCSLSEAITEHADLVSKYLYELVDEKSGKFEAMNSALFSGGIFIHVPDKTSVELPIHLIRQTGQATFPRLLVVVGRDSEITIIDEYKSANESNGNSPAYSNGVVEIFGEENSRTRYINIQQSNSNTISYLTHRARLAKSASMMTMPIAVGSSLSKQNFGVILSGRGADSRMHGLLFGGDRQHFDNHTLHHHASSGTYSNINMKVALRDKARSAYTGLIRIDADAADCEAFQENRNLLLTKGARAEAIPELEILNEDVSCSHGATVGPIDEMEIFYLKSRGIPDREAVRMIVRGFFSETIEMLPPVLVELTSDLIAARLEELQACHD
ncbi:MAG: Fe-S cluster assembly protein SufD [candidate division Zixibacteria bacterium]